MRWMIDNAGDAHLQYDSLGRLNRLTLTPVCEGF
jgi:hypothetical protein